MKYVRLLLFVFCALSFLTSFGKTIHFKKYENPAYRFYFFMPATWKIMYNRLQDEWVCMPLDHEERAMYNHCYEGIVFRMEYYYSGLDAALMGRAGSYEKVGDSYYFSAGLNDKLKVKNLQGHGWTGIYHNGVCGISCEGTGFHAAAGECENIYFSNGKITVSIETNGRAFDKSVLDMLLKSIHFY